jgi:hypothetical protein
VGVGGAGRCPRSPFCRVANKKLQQRSPAAPEVLRRGGGGGSCRSLYSACTSPRSRRCTGRAGRCRANAVHVVAINSAAVSCSPHLRARKWAGEGEGTRRKQRVKERERERERERQATPRAPSSCPPASIKATALARATQDTCSTQLLSPFQTSRRTSTAALQLGSAFAEKPFLFLGE